MAEKQPDIQPWLTVKLEEYRAIRAESVESIRSQHQVLVYSFALIGLLTAGAGQIWDKSPLIASVVLMLGVPSLAFCLTFVWLGEVERMMRAGRYIASIEAAVNHQMRSAVMGWETHLRGGEEARRRQLQQNYKAVLAVFLGIGLVSPWVGNIACVRTLNADLPASWYFMHLWGFLIAPVPASFVGIYDLFALSAFAFVISRVRIIATLFRDHYSNLPLG